MHQLPMNAILGARLLGVWVMVVVWPFSLLCFSLVSKVCVYTIVKYAGRQRERGEFWPTLGTTVLSRWSYILRWAGWRKSIPSRRYVFGALTVGAIMFAIGFGLIGVILYVLALSAIVGAMHLVAKKQQRLFIRQLPDAMQGLVDTLRAGYSLPQAIAFMVTELAPPIQQTFAALERAEKVGLDLAEALRRVSAQLTLPEWGLVGEALSIQESLGGNSIPLLQSEVATLRNRLAMEQEVTALTAAGRLSGYLMAGIAPVVLVVFWVMSPEYIGLLVYTLIGRLLLAVALILEIMGFVWIRKLVSLEY